MQRLQPANNDHGPRPARTGAGYGDVFDEDLKKVCRDEDGEVDLSNAEPVMVGRTGAFTRLRGDEYKKNPDGTYWLDPITKKPKLTQKDRTRYINTQVRNTSGALVVRSDYAQFLKEERNGRLNAQIVPACRSLADEVIGLGMVDECVPGIHSALLLLFVAEDTRELPRIVRYGNAYVQRAHSEVATPVCEAAVGDALIALYWPNSNRGGRPRGISTAGMRNRVTRHSPPSARTRARQFEMAEDTYAALREFAIAMFVGYYNEALRIWAEVSNAPMRDKDYMGGPKTRDHIHRRRPVKTKSQIRVAISAKDAQRIQQRPPYFGTR